MVWICLSSDCLKASQMKMHTELLTVVIYSRLFNAILQFVMERWESQIRQLRIGLFIDDSHFTNMRFADDTLLLATSKTDVIAMLDILS